MKKWLFWVLGIVLVLLFLLPYLLIGLGNFLLHDRTIPVKNELFSSVDKKIVLAFFPHPDDEITVAGTVLSMRKQGHDVHLVCLSRGEAGTSEGHYTPEKLAEIRSKELQKSAEILGFSSLHLLDYPDGGLERIGLDSLQGVAMEWIQGLHPDILLSYDSRVGLYGHSDHQLTGLAMESLFLEHYGNPGFSPEFLFQVTLSPKQIRVAKRVSEGFRRNYPVYPEAGLPFPDFSIATQSHFDKVLQAMQAHESQQKVLRDLMPYHDQLPSWIYSRIFGREYFYQVKPISSQ